MLQAISSLLSETCQKTISLVESDYDLIGNTTAVIKDNNGNPFFCKTSENEDSLSSEVNGLNVLQSSNTIRVPKVYCQGSFEDTHFVIIEYLEFTRGSKKDWYQMGKELAQLHRTFSNNHKYGFFEDNFIGDNPQKNQWMDSWADFFVECRLKPQIDLFIKNGYSLPNKELLLSEVHKILSNHHPEPSLLHGDLWGGNASFIQPSTPVLYDPACYYGDRETDIVMTKSFGSFPKSFYKGYEEEWALPDDWNSRFCIYDLYHVLNHANLFGGGFVDEVMDLVSSIV